MSDPPTEPTHPAQSPVESLSTHPASPFTRTESNIPPQVADVSGPTPPAMKVQSTWITYRSQIKIGLPLLAYMRLLIGSVTLLLANPETQRRYIIAMGQSQPATR